MPEFTTPLGTLFGTDHPTPYVVGVLDAPDQTAQAVEALRNAGFAGEAVRRWQSEQVLENHRTFMEQKGLIQRIGSAIDSDEQDALQDYLEQARKGRQFLMVSVLESGQEEQVHRILAAHGAHHLTYYGEGVYRDLDLEPE
jgi:hypothetical protein